MRRAPSLVWLLLVVACASAPPGVESITAADLAGRLESGDAPLVLDVRTEKEFAAGHIPGALNIPHDELAERIDELAAHRGDELVVHCQSGRRAGIAENVLHEHGFQNVRDLEGHWKQWQAEGRPAE